MALRKTIRSRRLGKQLREFRHQANLRQEDLVVVMNEGLNSEYRISGNHWRRAENGLSRLTPVHLARFCEVLEVEEEQAAALERLRAKADEPGWWQEYSDVVPEAVEMLVELGEDAAEIRTYDTVFIQGLLQTEAYTAAAASSARAMVHPIDVDRVVELRMRRQERLFDPDFAGLLAVMTEGAIRTVVGGPKVMSTQLAHLLKIGQSEKVSIHVLPFTVTPPGCDSLVIFSFPHESDNEVVYVDSDTAQRIHEDREPVRQCTYTFDMALGQALSSSASQELIRNVMRELQ
ncbi:helix-turn-helix domain-containing protein [Kibdelosporangium aridum]|uniref:helix-turn-helix domain-containing protein n=1 Tax=Kibdelosporangium aridum TaxID=2030 RepID=UPI0035F03FBE